MHTCIQWQGTGGFSRCEGTTKDQAVQNKKLRTGLAGDEHVTKLLGTYVIKGKGFVVLDHSHVMEHIRNCLNSMKKSSNNDDVSHSQWLIIMSIIFIVTAIPQKLDTKLSQMSTDDIDETKDDQQNESDSLKEAVGDMSVALDGVQKVLNSYCEFLRKMLLYIQVYTLTLEDLYYWY